MPNSLRTAVIRMAHCNSNLRPKLLPLLTAGMMPATPGEESWQSGQVGDEGWAPGYLTEHGEGHGDGSQTPPARDENGKILQQQTALYRQLELAAESNPSLQGRIAALIRARSSMSEGTFWKIVKQIGWSKSSDYKRIRKRLLALWTLEQADAARETFSKVKGRLYNRLERWAEDNDTSFGLGDDSFGDLLSHIIGLGKREYDAVMKDPQLAQKLARQGGYTESFAYVFPWKQDYEKLNVSVFVKWAEEAIQEYREASDEEMFAPLRSKIFAVVKILEILAKDGDWSNFLQTEERGKALSEELSSLGRKARERWEGPRWAGILSGANPMFNKWAVWNLYTDIRDYLD